MFFKIVKNPETPEVDKGSQACLVESEWNDFGFETLYVLYVFDATSNIARKVGPVKIGQFAMDDEWRPSLPRAFEALDERFFSVGQDDSYYENLNSLGAGTRQKILLGLHDISFDAALFKLALEEKVTHTSLLRFVNELTVTGQFRRIANGGVRLSAFSFKYLARSVGDGDGRPLEVSFEVKPESQPPSNVHVLIGRNGVGKTFLLEGMARSIVRNNENGDHIGQFQDDEGNSPEDIFANLVTVTFSAFDNSAPIGSPKGDPPLVKYAYIGLKVEPVNPGSGVSPKSPDQLAEEFGKSASVCQQGARCDRWRNALEVLEADSAFNSAGILDLSLSGAKGVQFQEQAAKLFNGLSSGHKIVMLTMTRLVECVEERTLVLVDEPEAHLHPPLLSALIRSLSALLVDRNGVAVIASHSPVVLQEVPSSCVWKIRRVGDQAIAERPSIQTFGENVGVLTREVFGLEIMRSGFHQMLAVAVDKGLNFEDILDLFDGELGGEARAVAMALIATRSSQEGSK